MITLRRPIGLLGGIYDHSERFRAISCAQNATYDLLRFLKPGDVLLGTCFNSILKAPRPSLTETTPAVMGGGTQLLSPHPIIVL